MNLKEWKSDTTKFLVIGESGTGKTRFAGTFPKPYLFSFDGGIDTLGGLDIEYDIFVEHNRKEPKAYSNFLQRFGEVTRDPRYETIILDNITNLSKFVLDELIYINQLVDKNLGDKCWDMYRMLKGKLGDIITSSVVQQKFVVCTALPEWETDKNTGEMKVFPSTEGRIRQELCPWFGEVYYTHVEKGKDGLKYSLRTKTDGKYTAKSRLDEVIKRRGGKGLPEFLEPSFDVLMSYVNPSKSGIVA